jgi:hypothetical protein
MASEFEAACEALSDVLITVDESFRVLYANPALTRVFGYTAGELVGQPIEWLIPERFHEEHARHARTFADGGERHRVMHRTRLVVGRHKSGAELKLEATVSRASAQGAARFAVVLRDVGEQLALERDFKALEERLQRIARLEALASLSAGIAHDFNNTLTVVLSLTRAVAESLPPESPEAHDLEEVMRAATRSAELTRRLLAFGRQGVRAEEAVDPGVVLHDLVSLARATSPASVHVVARLMPVLPLVRVDESQLAQALLNLVTNALFAMHEVGGMLELSAREQALDAPLLTSTRTLPPGRYLCVTVADTGRGISPDVLPRVFEPFFTTKPAGIGTGLGLSMVHGTVHGAGGALHLESEPKLGTKVSLWLPVVEGAAPAPVRERVASPARARRLLLVESDLFSGAALQRGLALLGHACHCVSVPDDVLTLLEAESGAFDALVLSADVPGLGRPGWLRRLRHLAPQLRLVLLSQPGAGLPWADHEAPGATVLPRPVLPTQLIEALEPH